eukprot:TRINITY_DN114332_c0_g1_i1.p1 TRINITY_DN114332_c0_g1~~TRINITY_DN114332_c0_g1_i1.p1  ORF type:complete len:630 (-),score=136.80 TRINITY_DN114332_c0_g1_i1:329-2218(-)
MAELFLAAAAWEATRRNIDNGADDSGKEAPLDITCAVALGGAYARTPVPSVVESSLKPWQVPNAFSVCNVNVLAGDRSLGTLSVPMVRLRTKACRPVDEWLAIAPSDGSAFDVRLRLLLYFRPCHSQGHLCKGAPSAFQRLCNDVLLQHRAGDKPETDSAVFHGSQSLDSRNGSDGDEQCEQPSTQNVNGCPAGKADPEDSCIQQGDQHNEHGHQHEDDATASKSMATDDTSLNKVAGVNKGCPVEHEILEDSLKDELKQLLRLGLQMKTSVSLPGSAEAENASTKFRCQDVAIYEEARSQLLAQKEALDRESAELHAHWTALRADHASRRAALESGRTYREEARASLRGLEGDVEETWYELREAQAVAAGRLATRRHLQRELTASIEQFSSEFAAQKKAGLLLREERATLREEAVSFGRELQACVSLADERVSENLEFRSEAAALQEAEEKVTKELERYSAGALSSLTAAAELCESLCKRLGPHFLCHSVALAEELEKEERSLHSLEAGQAKPVASPMDVQQDLEILGTKSLPLPRLAEEAASCNSRAATATTPTTAVRSAGSVAVSKSSESKSPAGPLSASDASGQPGGYPSLSTAAAAVFAAAVASNCNQGDSICSNSDSEPLDQA